MFDELAELGDTFGRSGYFALIITPSGQHREHRASSGVTFRVNEGVVERLAAVGDFEEACCLYESGRAETGYFLQVVACFEGTVFLAIFDDGVGNTGVDA